MCYNKVDKGILFEFEYPLGSVTYGSWLLILCTLYSFPQDFHRALSAKSVI